MGDDQGRPWPRPRAALPVLPVAAMQIINAILQRIVNDEQEVQQRILRQRRAFRLRMQLLNQQHEAFIERHRALVQQIILPVVLRPLRERGPNKIRSTDWWDRIVQEHYTDDDWLADFRMSRQSFENLCEMLQETLVSGPSLQMPLEPRKKVAVTLYKLASCSEYRVVGNQFGVHKSTVQQTVYSVIKTINTVLLPTSIVMPNGVEAREIAFLVERSYSFPQAYLAIDGSHIPILPPSDGYRDFVNRKGWPSIILQGVVDNHYRFRNISVLLPGSAHDARALSESQLFQHAHDLIPQVPKIIAGMEVPVMVVGDAAYPLLPWLMKGYTGVLTQEQESFNVYLSSFRMVVENAFGRPKARWRCLAKRIDIDYRLVPQVVAACCVLHNYVENGKEHFVEQWLEQVREAEVIFPQPELVPARDRDNYNMAQIRNHICQHLAHTLPLKRSRFQIINQ